MSKYDKVNCISYDFWLKYIILCSCFNIEDHFTNDRVYITTNSLVVLKPLNSMRAQNFKLDIFTKSYFYWIELESIKVVLSKLRKILWSSTFFPYVFSHGLRPRSQFLWVLSIRDLRMTSRNLNSGDCRMWNVSSIAGLLRSLTKSALVNKVPRLVPIG